MVGHKVYKSIVDAVESGRLKEPFNSDGFRSACPSFGEGTYTTFLGKHRVGNPGGNSELFVKISRGLFKLARPLKYDLA